MAYDIRGRNKGRRRPETWLFEDLQKLRSAVCARFEGLGFLQRNATIIAIAVAAKCASGAHPQFELAADGWRLSPDCSELPAALIEAENVAEALIATEGGGEDLPSLFEKSYSRDYRSQLARVALRHRAPEPSDDHFSEEDSEDAGVSPELESFRERSRKQLIGV